MKIKQAVTQKEQVHTLINKGLIVEDENSCIDFLIHTNYYRFSVYCESFRVEGKGQFLPGVTFEQIKNVYMFDQKIRSLLFEIVEEIEFALRTEISYHHGSKYGPEGYLNPINFNKLHDERNFNHHLKTVISENKDNPIIRHHYNKYEGKFPFWVIIEFFSMGMLSRFFRDMLNDDKNVIARMYDTTAANLENWVQCVTEVRNRCAHYSRIYDWNFKNTPTFIEKNYPRDNRKLYGQLLVLKKMYHDKKEWNSEILAKLKYIMNRYEGDINMNHIGFPNDWLEQLKSI